MPVYDYQCGVEGCGVVQELIQSIHKPLPESLSCPKCGGDSFHVFLVAPGVMTQAMTHQSIDVAIGRDAEARWEKVHERKAQRDKIRQDTGKTAITAVGMDAETKRFNEYVATDKKLSTMKTPEPQED